MDIKLGNKIITIDEHLIEMKDGRPVIKAWSKEIRHPDGRIDCEIHVPALRIVATKVEELTTTNKVEIIEEVKDGGTDGVRNL
jgi:hypothetical protein